MASKLLTKSKYLYGVQCPRLLWISTNQPELIPRPDAATQFIFDQGQQVGELAKKLFPDGIDIPHDSFMGNINETKELLASRKPLFEAGVMSGRLFSRTDILNPSIGEEWDIIEVKSSTEVKDINVHDVAFQKVCWEESGIKIGRTFLAYINNKYVKNGEISPEEFFFIEDITERVEEISDSTRDRIYEMLRILNQPDCPDALLGACCSDPYDCALMDACHAELPEHNVFTLYYGGKKACALYDNGIVEINDIPDDYKLSDKQQIQRSCLAGNSVYIDKNGIKDFLGTLKYPLYYLDFETFNTAVRYMTVPGPIRTFLSSFPCMYRRNPAVINHYWYLASGDGPERV